jgi:hypothetical protein
MSVELREMINFHLTGKRANDDAAVPGTDAVPALFAPYRKLTTLRYDFPLVLVAGIDTQAYVDTLTGVVNRLLRDIAPRGNSGAQLRQHVLRLERRMRELAADGRNVTLTELWKQAEKSLLVECDESQAEWFGNSIATARFALRTDGAVVDCDEYLPARLLEHAWAKLAKHRQVSPERINRLCIQLRNMLKVDDLKNAAFRTPQKLKTTLGKRYKEAFDFERMAELLDNSMPHNRLPAARRDRIATALAVLESQKYFAMPGKDDDLHTFVFDNLSAALKAYHERLPEIADVIRAISIADLELDNAYREDKHSAYFDRFGPQALTDEDLALFPSYLVCLHESTCNTRDLARLMEIVSGDLPMKVLLQVTDPLGEGSFVRQLVHTFVAGNAYVMQAPASNLYRQREQLQKGLEFAGPAIFSVFAPRSTASDSAALLPGYLVAAAAMESRVFPAFSYDPAAGEGLAVRFDISGNPDVEADWPRRALRYEDEALQTVTEDVAFTPVDFAVTNPKYGEHFSIAPSNTWTEDLTPVAACLEHASTDCVAAVPYVPVVRGDNVLQRLIVDDKLIRIARHCRERWHALQELGGVHNSYASAALADAGAEHARAEPVPAVVREPEVPVVEETISPVTEVDAEPGTSSDEAYIETPRCTTCDECTNRNDRMFAYDDNKQAYIKDLAAGTYRELVEAAEVCQVAIIHPGKPRDRDEAGLDELIARAAPFN